MRDAFGWDLEQYVFYGAYPGAAPLTNRFDRWLRYVCDSLIETTISRDVLLLTRVDKPALLRRLFKLGCAHSRRLRAGRRAGPGLPAHARAHGLRPRGRYLLAVPTAGRAAGRGRATGAGQRSPAAAGGAHPGVQHARKQRKARTEVRVARVELRAPKGRGAPVAARVDSCSVGMKRIERFEGPGITRAMHGPPLARPTGRDGGATGAVRS